MYERAGSTAAASRYEKLDRFANWAVVITACCAVPGDRRGCSPGPSRPAAARCGAQALEFRGKLRKAGFWSRHLYDPLLRSQSYTGAPPRPGSGRPCLLQLHPIGGGGDSLVRQAYSAGLCKPRGVWERSYTARQRLVYKPSSQGGWETTDFVELGPGAFTASSQGRQRGDPWCVLVQAKVHVMWVVTF